MRGYRLRHRLTIQKPVKTQNATSGGVTVEFEDLYLGVPAEVLTGAGKEAVISAATQNAASARINIRWFSVDPLELATYRILWDGRLFNIINAETDITGRQEWRLTCEDGLTDGR